MTSLVGKTIFISGSGGVSGKSHVKYFLRRGAKVIATDYVTKSLDTLAEQLAEHSDNLVVAQLDVSDETAISSFFSDIQSHEPNVFINNAAITGEQLVRLNEIPGKLADCTLKSWQAALDVNLTSAFLIAREIDRRFIGHYPCKLINVSSMYGQFSPHHSLYENRQIKPFPAYTASKAGIHGLTVWLAGYWAGKNATVNTLSPGGVFNNQDPKLVEAISELNMMSRMAQPNEISSVLAFLASDGSDYMTGQNVYADGGFSAW